LAYFFKFIIPISYITLFGILPLGIGLKNLWNLRKKGSKDFPNKKFRDLYTGNCIDSKISRETILKVASVTFFNGGDNIGVYMSLFASSGIIQLILTNSVFIILIGVWCLISSFMVKNRIIGYKLERYGHILLPFVLIIIGLVILSGMGPIFYPKP
jgi:cadmium resistance protein CadD (predicted permease)